MNKHLPFTIIYSCNNSITISHEILNISVEVGKRVIIPDDFKKDKIIIAVCEGEVNVLNTLGERICTDNDVA
ncbi:MAG: TIGR02922 family protein [Gammaproteobacteria bacterium]|nr:TIGR02922 family protein [Gammaproteobacteria bacterium]